MRLPAVTPLSAPSAIQTSSVILSDSNFLKKTSPLNNAVLDDRSASVLAIRKSIPYDAVMMPNESSTPTVYFIAGRNGAGKTTFASKYLPDFVKCREILNADLIAAGLSPVAPDTQNVRAGRLLLERMDELASQHIDFGFETTLAGRTYWKRLSELTATTHKQSAE